MTQMIYLSCLILANHTLGNFPRFKNIVQTQPADVTVRPDSLDPRQVFDLRINFDITGTHAHENQIPIPGDSKNARPTCDRSWTHRLGGKYGRSRSQRGVHMMEYEITVCKSVLMSHKKIERFCAASLSVLPFQI